MELNSRSSMGIKSSLKSIIAGHSAAEQTAVSLAGAAGLTVCLPETAWLPICMHLSHNLAKEGINSTLAAPGWRTWQLRKQGSR